MNPHFLLLVPFLLIATLSDAGLAQTQVTHILIADDIGPGINLTVHCSSRTADLGEHLLQYQAQSYSFEITERTDYSCRFSSQGRCHKALVFQSDREICADCIASRCGYCFWFVRADVLCRRSLDPRLGWQEFCHPWNQTC